MNDLVCFTEKEIKSRIDYSRQKKTIHFLNKNLYLSSVYPRKSRKEVQDFCQKYSEKNLKYLVVESENSLTVWIEKETEKNQPPSRQERKLVPDKGTIACVDDSKTIQYAVKTILESVGYKVLSIMNPSQEWKILLEKKPLLILMDLNMPNISGHQLCERLKKYRETKDIPIVMLTGNTGTFDRVRAKLNGANKYMTKPFTPEGLRTAVESLVTKFK